MPTSHLSFLPILLAPHSAVAAECSLTQLSVAPVSMMISREDMYLYPSW